MTEDKYGDLKKALLVEFEKVVGVGNEADDKLVILVSEALNKGERTELDARIKQTNPTVEYRLIVSGPFAACS